MPRISSVITIGKILLSTTCKVFTKLSLGPNILPMIQVPSKLWITFPSSKEVAPNMTILEIIFFSGRCWATIESAWTPFWVVSKQVSLRKAWLSSSAFPMSWVLTARIATSGFSCRRSLTSRLTRVSPRTPEIIKPFFLIASTVRERPIKHTVSLLSQRYPATTLPIAPAPMTAIFILFGESIFSVIKPRVF